MFPQKTSVLSKDRIKVLLIVKSIDFDILQSSIFLDDPIQSINYILILRRHYIFISQVFIDSKTMRCTNISQTLRVFICIDNLTLCFSDFTTDFLKSRYFILFDVVIFGHLLPEFYFFLCLRKRIIIVLLSSVITMQKRMLFEIVSHGSLLDSNLALILVYQLLITQLFRYMQKLLRLSDRAFYSPLLRLSISVFYCFLWREICQMFGKVWFVIDAGNERGHSMSTVNALAPSWLTIAIIIEGKYLNTFLGFSSACGNYLVL